MDFYSFAPIATALDVAYQLVMTLSSWLAPLAGSNSAAFAIVVLTLMVRTVLIPVGLSQVRAEITRRRLAPKLQQLQRKYKNNRELLQRKTLELYTSEKASPLAGIMPTLLQAPVLTLLYGLFIVPTINGHTNDLLTHELLGAPLGTSLVTALGAGIEPTHLAVFAGLLAVIAVVAWLSRRAALRFAPAAPDATPPAMARLTAALSWLPFLTVVFASFVPLAATLYLATTTTWTFVERTILRRVVTA